MYRVALLIIGLVVCLLPSFIAVYRNSRYKNMIILLNLMIGAVLGAWVGVRIWGLLGVGLAGWIAAMVWSLWPEGTTKPEKRS